MTIEKAHQAIGAYLCAFSALDRELGETVKVIFRLQEHEAADTIIAALGDFVRKAGLIGAAVKVAKNKDGPETTKEWRTAAEATINQILGCNNPDRTILAHSFLEPNEDASVNLTPLKLSKFVLKNSPETWAEKTFKQKINRLRELTQRLQQIKGDLSRFEVRMSVLSWGTIDAHAVAIGAGIAVQTAPAAISNSSSDDWLMLSPKENKRD
jgi:hypothetical protein